MVLLLKSIEAFYRIHQGDSESQGRGGKTGTIMDISLRNSKSPFYPFTKKGGSINVEQRSQDLESKM